MPPANFSIRPATAADADALAFVHRTCWQEAYGELVDPTLLAAKLNDLGQWRETWHNILRGEHNNLVACIGAAPVGFIRVDASRDPNPPTGLEIWAIYLLRRWHGQGIAQQLLHQAAEADAPLSAWVLENNQAALTWYARQGLLPDGIRKPYAPLNAWEIRVVRS